MIDRLSLIGGVAAGVAFVLVVGGRLLGGLSEAVPTRPDADDPVEELLWLEARRDRIRMGPLRIVGVGLLALAIASPYALLVVRGVFPGPTRTILFLGVPAVIVGWLVRRVREERGISARIREIVRGARSAPRGEAAPPDSEDGERAADLGWSG